MTVISVLVQISCMSLGQMCLLCSTLNFVNAYKTAPGTVHPATLVSCLPQISSQIQKGQQQCAAEFFQEYCRVLGNTASQYQTQQLIPASCNLSFLQSFFFELRSEVMCSSCDNITSNTTMETILPLHITKGCTVQSFLKDYSNPVELESSYYCSR
ncbi:unnamed protein product [Pocillopora meandrina]|uniref:Uncharacterized protein n=1 Tax=Pocillopora meandrina TaxID=46732 RepID=A0AAU9W6X7_9CNID|nr:unnamed protein product [Pocillopora meandrina]